LPYPFSRLVLNKVSFMLFNQANLSERDLGRGMSRHQWNFTGGRHSNRPININAVRTMCCCELAAAEATLVNGTPSMPRPACGQAGLYRAILRSAGPWVSTALTSFFRPSGVNPSLANALVALGAGGCVTLANAILQGNGIHSTCDAVANPADPLANCVPFSDMPANSSSGSSVYHALTANLRKRFGQHYEFLASYTWSHAIDDSTDLQSPLEPQDNYNPNAERSTSLFDQRHRFVFSGVYQSGHLGNSFAGKFFSNWTVAPIIEAVSGRPFNIITGDDRNFDFSTPTDRPLTTACWNAQSSCGDTPAASRSHLPASCNRLAS
jgi:hypothetical protein